MDYLIFFSWLIVLSWCLTRINFVQDAGLGSRLIIIIFFAKIIAGIASGWILHTHPDMDTWKYHTDGITEYHLLFSNPKEYFTNLFYSGYSYHYDGVLQTQNSYWNDLKTNLMVKLVSVLHIFSHANYYTNVVLYNFLTFFGHIALYRTFKQVYQSATWVTVVLVFLLPSLLFYSSAIHKEGLMLAATGIIVFNMYNALHTGGFRFKRWLYIFLSLLLIFLFRNFIVFAMLPALVAMMIAYKRKGNPLLSFAVVYLIAAILFFNLHRLAPAVDLPGYMVQKQSDFLNLEKGNTTIPINTLQPSFSSYIRNAPQALEHGLSRPFITDMSKSLALLPLAIELIFYLLLILVFFFFRKTNPILNHPFVLFGLFFSLSLCLIIGYTVPVIGAIVRYRSIYLPFILAPFILNTDWATLKNIFKLKN